MDDSKTQWNQYERALTARIVKSINAVRNAHGLTIKELRTRLVALGWPISEATLSGMLSADKRGSISIGEITAFATVLSVAPAYLILGLPDGSPLPAIGQQDNPENEYVSVYSWLIGQTIDVYDAADRETAKQSARALHFANYTGEMSIRIWQSLYDLLALISYIESDQDWLNDQIQVTRSDLEKSFIYLRRMRNRHRNLAPSQPLARTPLPPMPPGLEFVDSSLPIDECVSKLDSAAIEKICTKKAKLDVSIKALERKYEQHITDSAREVL